jgi:hypothetical protein
MKLTRASVKVASGCAQGKCKEHQSQQNVKFHESSGRASVDQYECLHDFDVNLFPGLPASGIDLFYFLLCFALSGACKKLAKGNF